MVTKFEVLIKALMSKHYTVAFDSVPFFDLVDLLQELLEKMPKVVNASDKEQSPWVL